MLSVVFSVAWKLVLGLAAIIGACVAWLLFVAAVYYLFGIDLTIAAV